MSMTLFVNMDESYLKLQKSGVVPQVHTLSQKNHCIVTKTTGKVRGTTYKMMNGNISYFISLVMDSAIVSDMFSSRVYYK